MRNSWEEEKQVFYSNIELLEKMIVEAHRRIQILNERLNIIEKRKPQIREFLQN